MDRINGQLRRDLSELLARSLRDPRLPTLVSITEVHTSADMKRAKVYFSVLGDSQEKDDALEGLTSAAGFLHRELKHRVPWRSTPQLQFLLDDSIEKGSKLLQEIDKLSHS